MTRFDDPRLNGRHPEFARMSLKPGLGTSAMHDLADQVMRFNLDETQGDVPSSLRHGAKILPLGRYLRRKLRTYVGKDEKAPESTLAEMAEEVRAMWDSVALLPSDARRVAIKNALIDADNQRVLNMETRRSIYEKGKRL